MTFYIIKKEEYHFILPSQYKYDFLDGYPRGSAGINMFSISNMSEFVPRGGGKLTSLPFTKRIDVYLDHILSLKRIDVYLDHILSLFSMKYL